MTGDRRRSVLALTARGRSVYARSVPLARDYERRLLAALPPRERTRLGGMLSQLQRHAERLGPAAGPRV